MQLFAVALVWILALLVLFPAVVFCLECLLALLPGVKYRYSWEGPRPDVAILIPAHNEADTIARTLEFALAHLTPADRLLVVADNCSDDTAEIARSHGAEVVERHDLVRRGKGYALERGVQALAAAPRPVVIVIDADTRAGSGIVEVITRVAQATGRPVQALNLCNQGRPNNAVQAVSALAIHFKNEIRPLGLKRMGFPCLLMGSGMAFPWEVLRAAPLGTSHITEDMQLGVDLALAGHPPLLCEVAEVHSLLAPDQAFVTQRTRWEHGHMQLSLEQVPRLLRAAVGQRRLDLLALACDLCIPPLSLLVTLLLAVLVIAAGLWWWTGVAAPVLALGSTCLLMSGLIAANWWKFGREEIPFHTLAAAPWYLLTKLPIYLGFLFRRQVEWVRTDRARGDLPSTKV